MIFCFNFAQVLSAEISDKTQSFPLVIAAVGNVDDDIMQFLKARAEKRFGLNVVIEDRIPVPDYAYNKVKKQYSPNFIIYALKKEYGHISNHVIGVTEMDLKDENGKCKYVWSWVFYGDSGVVSLSRIRPRSMSYRYTLIVEREIRILNWIMGKIGLKKTLRENIIRKYETQRYSKESKKNGLKIGKVIDKLMGLAGIKKTDDEILKHRLEMIFLKKAAESYGIGESVEKDSFLYGKLTSPWGIDNAKFKLSKKEKFYLEIAHNYENNFIYADPSAYIQKFEKTKMEKAKNPAALTNYGIALVYNYLLGGEDNLELAEKLLVKAVKKYNKNLWAWSYLARINHIKGNKNKFEYCKKQVTGVNDNYLYMHYRFGWRLLELKEYKKAAEEFEQGFILGAWCPDYADIPEEEKKEYFGNIVPAIDKMLAAISDRKTAYSDTVYFAAMTYYHAGEYEKSLKVFEELINSESFAEFEYSANVYNMLAYILADKLERDYETALEAADKAVRMGLEKSWEGYYRDTRAWVLYKMGKYSEAKEEIERAIELIPDCVTFHEHLGAIKAKMNGYKREMRSTSAVMVEDESAPATIPYRTVCKIAKLDFSHIKGVTNQSLSFSVQSENPEVSIQDIRMFIDAKSGHIPLDISTSGVVSLQVIPKLLKENPMVVANQPKGSLILRASISIKATLPDEDLEELKQFIEEKNK